MADKRFKAWASTLALAITVAVPAVGQVAIFDDEAQFLAGIANPLTFDFEVASGFPAAPGPGSFTFEGAVFAAQTFTAPPAVSGTQSMTGAAGTFSQATVNFSGQASKPTAFGFWALDLTVNEIIRVTVDHTNQASQTYDVMLAAGAASLTPTFFGLYWNDTIESLTFIGTDTTSSSRAWLIDDLTTNNGGTHDLEVVSFSGPVSALLDAPIGSAVSLTIRNAGSAAIPPGTSASIGFYISSDNVITTGDRLLSGGRENIASQLPGGLAAGASAPITLFSGANISSTFPDNTPLTGSVFLGVVLDEFDSVTESNESNNTASVPIEVLTLPDLVIESITHSPATPNTETNILFTATVKNVGTTAAGPSTLSFKIGGESPSAPEALFAVPALAPGETFGVSRNETLGVAQNYTNTATADFNNEVVEFNEGNNTATDSYTVTLATEVAQQYTLVSLPLNGTLYLDEQFTLPITSLGTFNTSLFFYKPNTGFTGSDGFSYQIEQGGLVSNIADIDLRVVNVSLCSNCNELSITFLGSGSGDVAVGLLKVERVCSSPESCTVLITPGEIATLQARPTSPAFTFGGWGGACASAGSSALLNLTMDSDKACTATFNVAQ